MIELQNVVKNYDGKAAVDGVSLRVPQGRIYGLIGPNGAGKTTSLKMMATLIKPDEGQVRIGDIVLPDQMPEARRLIGYMPDRQSNFRTLRACTPSALQCSVRCRICIRPVRSTSFGSCRLVAR